MRRARCKNTCQEYTGRPRDSLQKQRHGRTAAVSHWECFWTPGASEGPAEYLGGFLGTDILARGPLHLHHLHPHLRHRRQQPPNDQHFGAHGFTRGPFFRCILRAPSSRRVGGPYRHGQLGRNDLFEEASVLDEGIVQQITLAREVFGRGEGLTWKGGGQGWTSGAPTSSAPCSSSAGSTATTSTTGTRSSGTFWGRLNRRILMGMRFAKMDIVGERGPKEVFRTRWLLKLTEIKLEERDQETNDKLT